MSSGETEAWSKGGKEVLGTGRFGFGGDVEGGLVGGTRRGGEGNVRDGDGYGRLIKWGDNVVDITLGTDHNDPLSYAPGLELHHHIMSTLGVHIGQLEMYRYIERLPYTPTIQVSSNRGGGVTSLTFVIYWGNTYCSRS